MKVWQWMAVMACGVAATTLIAVADELVKRDAGPVLAPMCQSLAGVGHADSDADLRRSSIAVKIRYATKIDRSQDMKARRRTSITSWSFR